MATPLIVLQAAIAALSEHRSPALAIVLSTEGSTYSKPGAVALFGQDIQQVGWLSGGCLEPEFQLAAERSIASGSVVLLDVDSLGDEYFLSGSAVGCRGRLLIAMIPLRRFPAWLDALSEWNASKAGLRVYIDRRGPMEIEVNGSEWASPGDINHEAVHGAWPTDWHVAITRPPALLLFGAGPETEHLLPLLKTLGWATTLIEKRQRWLHLAQFAEHWHPGLPVGESSDFLSAFDAALIMHHNFELDREALAALADTSVPFIGLLGPTRRRDDLFKTLAVTTRERLLPRLRSPVGLSLGGTGEVAIALSIAAQIHQHIEQTALNDPKRLHIPSVRGAGYVTARSRSHDTQP